MMYLIDAGFKMLEFYFCNIWKMQQWVMEWQKGTVLKYRKARNILYGIAILLLIINVACGFQEIWLVGLQIGVGLLLAVTFMITSAYETLTSVRGFLKNCIEYTIGVVLIMMTIMLIIFFVSKNEIIVLVGSVVAPMGAILAWIHLSCLANAKVAAVVNGVLTIIMTMLLQIVHYILTIYPPSYFPIEKMAMQDLESFGYTRMQMIEIMINTVTLPVVLSFGLATAVCIMKAYWVEKYNKGNDINIELNVI